MVKAMAVGCKVESRCVVISILQNSALLALGLLFFLLTVSADLNSGPASLCVGANANGVHAPCPILTEDATVVAEPVVRGERLLQARHPKGKGKRGHKGMHWGMVGMHGGKSGIVRAMGLVTAPPSGLLSFDDFDVDYGPERVSVLDDGTISLKLDRTGGVRLRSKARYQYGTFSFDIKSSWPDTPGVVGAIYLSSRLGLPPALAEEIDWEFKRSGSYSGVQTNFFAAGIGGNERQASNVPGYEAFKPYTGFNKYTIEWTADHITFFINGVVLFRYDSAVGAPNHVEKLPIQPMYLFMSIWEAKWTGDINWWAGPLSIEIRNIDMQPWNLLPTEYTR